jgi:hypothetical protein
MRRRILPILLLVACAAAAPAAHAAERVRVVRCPTTFGIPRGQVVLPSHLRVLGSAHSTAGLAAYSDTYDYLIAPAHMRCRAAVGADGTAQISVRRGAAELTLDLAPDCTSCQADLACPFFPAFARGLDFPCANGIPPDTHVVRPSRDVALFSAPSVDGVVGIHGRRGLVYGASCRLQARQRGTCTSSLDDVLRRYG